MIDVEIERGSIVLRDRPAWLTRMSDITELSAARGACSPEARLVFRDAPLRIIRRALDAEPRTNSPSTS